MGRLAIKKYFSFLFLIATFLVAVFTFFGLWGGSSNPIYSNTQAMLVYVLPLLIVANAIFLVFWLIRRRWHWAAIPFVTLLCCIPYIGTIYQFGSADENAEKKSGLTVATYNVASFNRETTGFIAQDILANMRRHKVDVLCIQEYNDYSGDKRNSAHYKEYFPFVAYGINEHYVIYSRYPIKDSKPIEFPASNNGAMWADIEINGKVFRVFNVHLETAGVHHAMGRAAQLEQQGYNVENNRLLSAIYGTYTVGIVKRAGQANMLANEIRQSEYPVILAGDCVDVPYSYVYETLKGELTDGFKECGSGWMYTLRGKSRLRIDYIFHSDAFKGITYYKEDLSYSDHLPVFMKMELKEEED